ncbi:MULTISPECIES: amidohydrolase family protein [Sphingobacterium]|uniref:Amidohydrolase family protein n=1 Tax=Sphingobacterium multivorum TaxID=28454 RepID=A0ABX7CR95_SPHMU|nr:MULTISPECIES: amidohydrolase family protein [Sphingobacterium]QQT29717.1 amidohydrolase family protein [Sphingobacterium multivorum]QQT54264.1 amidohydrolase family protein [Sphingobacterium multivorum]QRY59437.1 amidohydrolase family protein [Sphingobacterium siyangense]
MRIDTHQHFWKFDPIRDSWITEEMQVIKRDFSPLDIQFVLERNGFGGSVAVQADQSKEETAYLVQLANDYPFIKGVVGWIDLQAADIRQQLDAYQSDKVIKGFRHIVEGEADPDFLIRPAVLNGLKALADYGYTYDLLIRPRHYAATLDCVQQNPNLQFVLDHIAKPPIKSKAFDEWAAFIDALSAFPNVVCKVSGLATEADWEGWKLDDFKQYLEHIFARFGKERIMYGSDWPVCLLAASYEESIAIVEDKLGQFTAAEKNAFWAENAIRVYNL